MSRIFCDYSAVAETGKSLDITCRNIEDVMLKVSAISLEFSEDLTTDANLRNNINECLESCKSILNSAANTANLVCDICKKLSYEFDYVSKKYINAMKNVSSGLSNLDYFFKTQSKAADDIYLEFNDDYQFASMVTGLIFTKPAGIPVSNLAMLTKSANDELLITSQRPAAISENTPRWLVDRINSN